MLAVHNADAAAVKDAIIDVDLNQLGLAPRLPWQDFVGVRDLHKDDKDPVTVLDSTGRTLTVKGLAPNRGRLVGIRKY
jgi:hypothetical protein